MALPIAVAAPLQIPGWPPPPPSTPSSHNVSSIHARVGAPPAGWVESDQSCGSLLHRRERGCVDGDPQRHCHRGPCRRLVARVVVRRCAATVVLCQLRAGADHRQRRGRQRRSRRHLHPGFERAQIIADLTGWSTRPRPDSKPSESPCRHAPTGNPLRWRGASDQGRRHARHRWQRDDGRASTSRPTPRSSPGWLVAYPCGQPTPSSTVNWQAGDTAAALTLVNLSPATCRSPGGRRPASSSMPAVGPPARAACVAFRRSGSSTLGTRSCGREVRHSTSRRCRCAPPAAAACRTMRAQHCSPSPSPTRPAPAT